MSGGWRNNRELKHNRLVILGTQNSCALCGGGVDKDLPYKDSDGKINMLAPVVDHIIPVKRGGHPSDISNLQLTHHYCNSVKGKKLDSELNKKDFSNAVASKTLNFESTSSSWVDFLNGGSNE